MHKEILTAAQVDLLPLVRSFSDNFGLVGGTAIALHLGHRESIDFDLFTDKDFDNKKIRKKIERRRYRIQRIFMDETGQYTIVINGVHFTFFRYDYPIRYTQDLEKIIALPDLATLAAMKAFALGRRPKWKDYVDLYFILRDHLTLEQISKKAKQIFGNEYNERIFRGALSYFKDINYGAGIAYKSGFKVSEKTVKRGLEQMSLEWGKG